MSVISNTIIAFSLSADAFAAAIGKGLALRKPTLLQAVRIGLIFGVVETITPIIGWLLGTLASDWIEAVDHWIAFGILMMIGAKMMQEGFAKEEKERKESHNIGVLVLTAFGTSIDAMAIGATMAFLNVNIWIMSLMIGSATFLMATIGILAGHRIGTRAGRTAEVLGGLCLMAIGTKILLEHLGIALPLIG